MAFETEVDQVLGLFAYDTGSVDSGIKDDGLKGRLKDHPELDEILRLCFVAMSTPPYGYEDCIEFTDWLQHDSGLGDF